EPPETEHHVRNSGPEGERTGTILADREPDDGNEDQSPGQVQSEAAPHLSSSLDGRTRGAPYAAYHDAADHPDQYWGAVHELTAVQSHDEIGQEHEERARWEHHENREALGQDQGFSEFAGT